MGVRYSAEEGKEAGFIDRVVPPHQVVTEAMRMAADVARTEKNRNTLQKVKQDIYHELCRILNKPAQLLSNL